MHPTDLKKTAATIAIGLGLFTTLLAGAVADTLKIGVIAPLTGAGAPWGLATANGPKILAAEINARGGLDVGGKKYQVEIVAYDDQYKAADAVAAYNRLINRDGVKYVIIMTSAATMALKQNVEDDQVIALTSSYSAGSIDGSSKHMFRLFSAPADYLPALVKWMKDNIKERRIALINPNDDAGWDHAKLSDRLFRENGFKVVGNEMAERAQKDFQPLLTKIMAQQPEVIELGATSPANAGLIVRQARELGFKGLFTKTGGAGPRDMVSAAGKEAAEGTINMLYADPANKGYQQIVAQYRKSLGQDPNEIIVAFYDGANVLLHAIQKAGDVNDIAKVMAAFPQALPMTSVQGDTLTFGGKATTGIDHQIMTVNYVGKIKGGEPVVIGKVK